MVSFLPFPYLHLRSPLLFFFIFLFFQFFPFPYPCLRALECRKSPAVVGLSDVAPDDALQAVFQAVVVNKLTYAGTFSPALQIIYDWTHFYTTFRQARVPRRQFAILF